MNITIIGAGAMGGLFAARLDAAGEHVAVVDVWAEHIACINEKGLTLHEQDHSKLVAWPLALRRPEDAPTPDLIIIFVKSTMTRAAAESAKTVLGPHTCVLTLQNGLGNAELIADVVGADRVVAGTTAQGATLLGPGRIRHGGNGKTHIGCMTGGVDEYCQDLAGLFTRAGLPTVADTCVTSMIWGKLIINVGINAVTALLKIRNNQLVESEMARELVSMAVEEAVAVAEAAGVALPYEDPVHEVLAIATETGANHSSMLQDILHERKTEVEMINGAIVREGERLGVPTPVNKTLTLLIGCLERGTEKTGVL